MRFYKIKTDYKGERYFKVYDDDEFPENFKVVQVCVSPGKMKKGRAHQFGITLMSRISLAGNYAFYKEFRRCTQQTYQAAFDKVLKRLKR